jgi:hypothetical protein
MIKLYFLAENHRENQIVGQGKRTTIIYGARRKPNPEKLRKKA